MASASRWKQAAIFGLPFAIGGITLFFLLRSPDRPSPGDAGGDPSRSPASTDVAVEDNAIDPTTLREFAGYLENLNDAGAKRMLLGEHDARVDPVGEVMTSFQAQKNTVGEGISMGAAPLTLLSDPAGRDAYVRSNYLALHGREPTEAEMNTGQTVLGQISSKVNARIVQDRGRLKGRDLASVAAYVVEIVEFETRSAAQNLPPDNLLKPALKSSGKLMAVDAMLSLESRFAEDSADEEDAAEAASAVRAPASVPSPNHQTPEQ